MPRKATPLLDKGLKQIDDRATLLEMYDTMRSQAELLKEQHARIRDLEKRVGAEPLSEEDLNQEDVIKVCLSSTLSSVLSTHSFPNLMKDSNKELRKKVVADAVKLASEIFNEVCRQSRKAKL